MEGGNWKFQATTVERYQVELETSVLFFFHFYGNISVPSALPVVKFNYSEVESLINRWYSVLPELHELNKVNIVILSGSMAGYIAKLMIIIIVIVVFTYRCIKGSTSGNACLNWGLHSEVTLAFENWGGGSPPQVENLGVTLDIFWGGEDQGKFLASLK